MRPMARHGNSHFGRGDSGITSFCAGDAVNIGEEYLRKIINGDDNPSSKYLQKARLPARKKRAEKRYKQIWGSEGYPDGGLPMHAWNKYVDMYPDRRVMVVITQGQLFEKWEVEEFKGINFKMDGLGTTATGDPKTIHVAFNTQTNHYLPLKHNDWTKWQAKYQNRSQIICPGCLDVFVVDSAKRKQEYRMHPCEGRTICEGCGLMFDDEHYHSHKQQKPATDCQECGEHLYGELCAIAHTKNVCKNNAQHCKHCKGAHKPKSECLPYKCPSCPWRGKEDQILSHICYFTLADENVKAYEKSKTWVFDLESMIRPRDTTRPQENILVYSADGVYDQVPIVGGIYCLETGETHIWENWKDEPEKNIFDKFLEFFADPEKIKNKEKHLVYAHNGGKYDWRLFFAHILRTDRWRGHGLIKGKPIIEGSNIKQMRVGTATLHDSYNHISKPLRMFPAMFELGDVEKGIFPYSFCKPTTINYRGAMPPIEFYEFHKNRVIDLTSDEKELEKFQQQYPTINISGNYLDFQARIKKEIEISEAWYEVEKQKFGDNGWYIREQYLKYFKPDLEILAKGMAKYAEICMSHGINDPIGVMTLASNAMATFRKRFLTRKEFNKLEYMEQQQLTKEMIPCLKYYPGIDIRPCGINEEACARKAYSGGRTELFKIHHKVDRATEKMWGVDACSMYPAQCVNHRYPTGRYNFTPYCVGDQPNMEQFYKQEGVARVEIMHPTGMRVPLLWSKVKTGHDIKLGFTNKKCLTKKQIEHWEHWLNRRKDDDSAAAHVEECDECKEIAEHSVTVYTMPELRAAKKAGYILSHVYWTLFSTEYCDDLFNIYYVLSFGLKTEYGKAPKGYDWNSPEDCAKYRRQVRETCGAIIPDNIRPDKWHKNQKAVKEVAKLYANSLYGKFGSNPHKTTTLIFDDDFNGALDALSDETKKSNSFSYGNTTVVKQSDASRPSEGYGNTNVMIASYVTAYARINWWEMASFFAEHGTLIYGDTDSVIGTLPIGMTPPKMGIFLGNWEDDFGYEAVEFVGIAAKSYMVKDADGNVRKAKMKGLTLNNGHNADTITFDWMVKATEAMIKGKIESATGEDFRMRNHEKNTKDLGITSEIATKTLVATMVQLKGDLATDGTIYPFGSGKNILGDAELVKDQMLVN